MLTALQNPPTPFLRLFSLFFPEVYLAMAAQSLCLLFRYISLICSPTNALSLSIPLAHIHKHRHTYIHKHKHKRTHKHKNTLSLFHSLTSHRQMTAAQLSIFIRVFAYVNMGVYVYLLIRLKLRTQIEKKRVAK